MSYYDCDYEYQGPLCAVDGCGQPAEVEVILPGKKAEEGRRYGDHVCLCWKHMKINEAAKADESERFGVVFYPFVSKLGMAGTCSYVDLESGEEVEVYDLSLDELDADEVREHAMNVQRTVDWKIKFEQMLHAQSERTKQSIAKKKAVA